MIAEDYVSFETAKLLKEKGFDGEVLNYFNMDIRLSTTRTARNWNRVKVFYSAPTLQMAMKWLREVHNIVIVLTPSMFWGKYNVAIYKRNNEQPFGFDGDSLVPSYEEAAEAAIKYCLKNLI